MRDQQRGNGRARQRRRRVGAALAAVALGFGGAAAVDGLALAAPPVVGLGDYGPAGDGLTRMVVTADGGAVDQAQLDALGARAGVVSVQRVFDGSALVATRGLVPQDLRPVVPGATVELSATGTMFGTTVTDPLWSAYGYNLQNNGHNAYAQSAVAGADVAAPTGWQAGTGSGRIVAVVDSGWTDHPDLAGALWTNPDEPCGSVTDADGDGLVGDCHGWNFYSADADVVNAGGNEHGTGVAGIVGARAGNGQGSAGVAPDVTIMPLVAGYGTRVDITAAAQAIVYAVDHGADVINASWGGPGTTAALDAAIAYANAHGVIVVAAAGNDAANRDATPMYPANSTAANVITVGSSTGGDKISDFSAYGATSVDLFAPGQYIVSPSPDGGYVLMNGTSMAAPEVAAAVALYRDRDPSATAAALRAKLLADVQPVPAFAGRSVTGGRLSLAGLGNSAASVRYSFTGLTATPGTVTPQVVVDGSTPPGTYSVRFGLGMEYTGEVFALSRHEVTLDGVTATTDDAGEVTFDLGARPSAGPLVLAPATDLQSARYVLTVQMYRDGAAEGLRFAAPLQVGTTTPGTTTPGTSSPGTTTPGTSSPGTSTPGTTTPGTTTPGTSSPGTTTPGATTPGTSTPGGTTPGTSTPAPITPGSSSPNTPSTDPGNGPTSPGTTEPGTTTPGTTTPGTTTPGTSTPDTSTPGTGTPGTATPTPSTGTDGGSTPDTGTTTYPAVGPYRLTSLSPTRVSTVGGTTVTVTGEAIPAGALVRVGATGSATVVSVSTTRLTFTAPALAAGTYDVYVFGPDRTTYSVLTGALQYVAPDGRTGTPGTGTPGTGTPGTGTPGAGTPGTPGTGTPGTGTPGTGTPGTGTDPGFVTGPNGERLVRSASWAALAPRIWKVACSAACSGISV